ncbi:hypothetical protein [Aliidiomarina indica]|uniref:hypothetical protein n=1 Tax=Aliidiomarina indica TaxID=2749147 RepID=UPI00188E5AAE|nr:hypothetical protein [Aliidiomarina indica]
MIPAWGRPIAGQALVEGMLALLLFVLIGAAVAQILWLFGIQQLSQAATLYAAKQGARTNLETTSIRFHYGYRMRGIPGVNPALLALDRLHPSDALMTQMSERSGSGTQVLTDDFHGPRLQLLSPEQREAYLDARILTIAVRLCVDLKMPIAGKLLSSAQAFATGAQPCGWLGYALAAPFEVRTQATVPIESRVYRP